MLEKKKSKSLTPLVSARLQLPDWWQQMCERPHALHPSTPALHVKAHIKPLLCDIIPPVYTAAGSLRAASRWRHSSMDGWRVNSCCTNGPFIRVSCCSTERDNQQKVAHMSCLYPVRSCFAANTLDILAVRQLCKDFPQTDGIRGRKQEGLPLKFVLYPSNTGTDVSAVLVSRELMLKRPDVDLNSSKQLSALTFCIPINFLHWYAVPLFSEYTLLPLLGTRPNV